MWESETPPNNNCFVSLLRLTSTAGSSNWIFAKAGPIFDSSFLLDMMMALKITAVG